eukprot:363215-Chlamydomonas_euryale.AAC.8
MYGAARSQHEVHGQRGSTRLFRQSHCLHTGDVAFLNARAGMCTFLIVHLQGNDTRQRLAPRDP